MGFSRLSQKCLRGYSEEEELKKYSKKPWSERFLYKGSLSHFSHSALSGRGELTCPRSKLE
jgi:hypothetical protein